MGTRLNKYISDSGYCSRREADRFIEMGKVMVGRNVAKVGDKVTGREAVKVNGHKIDAKEDYVYIALNKPAGITCTTDPSDPTNIVKFVNYPTRIFNIGRLDKDSEGLILLTDNGDIVNKILRAGNNHEKEYEITVDKSITTQFIEQMSNGVRILGTTTKKCEVIKEGDKSFRIILTQGLNRQIRRMCEALDYDVVKLRRTRIMNITTKKLPLEQWRFLTEQEMEVIMGNIEESDGEEEASRSKRPSGKRPTSNFHKKRNISTSDSRERGSDSPSSGFGKPTRGRKPAAGGRFSADSNGDRPTNSRNTSRGRNSVDERTSKPKSGRNSASSKGGGSDRPTRGRNSASGSAGRPTSSGDGRSASDRSTTSGRPTGSQKPTTSGKFSTSGGRKPAGARFAPTSSSKTAGGKGGKGSKGGSKKSTPNRGKRR